MLILSPRARQLALVSAVALAFGLLAYLLFRPPPQPGIELPSVLPSNPSHGAAASGSPQPEVEVLLAVGDIGSCDSQADDAVAELASRLGGTLALLGDTVYEQGTPQQYDRCFDPAWGRMRARFRPAVGNHEYLTDGAAGYFGYFGSAAGAAGEGWYSYQLGGWHVVVLNSNCSIVSCGEGSPQMRWLTRDLAAHPSDCLLAYWHHPRWSSGRHGSTPSLDPFWMTLSAAGADVVLAGHDHTYERLRVGGVREFVVGTGGRSIYPFEKPQLPQTEVRSDDAFGLLRLALAQDGYSWQFVALGRSGFTDTGSGSC
jgi:acid phosphatase type 7